jgi:hypothetical protein
MRPKTALLQPFLTLFRAIRAVGVNIFALTALILRPIFRRIALFDRIVFISAIALLRNGNDRRLNETTAERIAVFTNNGQPQSELFPRNKFVQFLQGIAIFAQIVHPKFQSVPRQATPAGDFYFYPATLDAVWFLSLRHNASVAWTRRIIAACPRHTPG